MNMPNYCRKCCKKFGIKYNPVGKTCYVGMICNGCGKRLWWYEQEKYFGWIRGLLWK